MAKARIIVKRRKAVRNIRKITKVMQMIASSRYQKAYKRAMGTKPYVRKIAEMVASAVQAMKAAGDDIEHPLMKEPASGVKNTAILILTSNRGLCGGYNGGVQRLAGQTIRELRAAGDKVDIHVAGKKGVAYVKFLGLQAAGTYTAISDMPRFAEVVELADKFMQQYIKGEISGLKLIYTRFISPSQQKAVVVDVLPLSNIAGGTGDAAKAATDEPKAKEMAIAYDFIPSAQGILEELIPTTVKIGIFQAFIDAAVSEQIARMVAMKAATDNAEKLGKKLTQDYNRARQSQITSELSELMGGVEAMK
jgi:F-type H+-transporting ATPase subunit gamma